LFDREKYVDDKALIKTPPYYQTHNDALKTQGREINPYVYNVETLGFRLDSAKEIAVFRDQAEPEHHKIDDFFSYVGALIGTVMETQSTQHLHSDDWQRTIYVDTLGVGTTDFDLSDERKAALAESGRTHTEKYFDWYDDPANRPANRPAAQTPKTGRARVIKPRSTRGSARRR
jgi:NTE family protein